MKNTRHTPEQIIGKLRKAEVVLAIKSTLDPGGAVDAGATAELRRRLEAEKVRARVVADDALEPYAGARGRHRRIRLHPALAVRLDAFARDVLGVSSGDRVILRKLPAVEVPGGLAR